MTTTTVSMTQTELEARIAAAVAKVQGTLKPEPKPEPKAMTMAEEIAFLTAENAKIKAAEAAKVKKPRIPNAAIQPVSEFIGTYPEGATPQDKVILDAIHKAKSPLKEGSKYAIPATYGKDLYGYLHALLKVKYPPTETGNKEKPWNWAKADAMINPAIDSAIRRGIVTRTFGEKTACYFDSREKAPVLSTRAVITDTAVAAAVEAF